MNMINFFELTLPKAEVFHALNTIPFFHFLQNCIMSILHGVIHPNSQDRRLLNITMSSSGKDEQGTKTWLLFCRWEWCTVCKRRVTETPGYLHYLLMNLNTNISIQKYIQLQNYRPHWTWIHMAFSIHAQTMQVSIPLFNSIGVHGVLQISQTENQEQITICKHLDEIYEQLPVSRWNFPCLFNFSTITF